MATGDTTEWLKCGRTPLTKGVEADDSRGYGLNLSVRWCAADTDGMPAAFSGPATLAPGGDRPGCQNCKEIAYEYIYVNA